MSGKQRIDRWRQRRRQRERDPDFRYAPLLIEGSGGLTAHLGRQGEREQRRTREREQERAAGPYISQPDGDTEDRWRAHSLDRDPRVARKVDQQQYPGRWTFKHRSQRWWVPDVTHQLQLTIEDQVYAPGEVTELSEAAILGLLDRRPWVRFVDPYVQRIVLELEKGPRPISAFPRWLSPLLPKGLGRLRRLNRLVVALRPNIWYRGRGRPKNYEVITYALKPEPRRKP